MARDEELLVDQAAKLRFSSFVQALSYWEQFADPDGTEGAAEARRCARGVHLEQSVFGTWLGQVTLDPIGGAIVAGELERLENEAFETDWTRARAELGRDPTTGELPRTRAERRADALVEMATRSRTAPPDGQRPAPLFSVLIDEATLFGRILELADGTVVTPGAVVPHLTRAHLERAVFTPKRRVEVGARARLFTGATRRAVELRDRTCAHPYCDAPAPSCQVDHIVPYTEGGPTTQENGRLLCGFHNRLRNQRPPRDG
jgi:hypothetical protein